MFSFWSQTICLFLQSVSFFFFFSAQFWLLPLFLSLSVPCDEFVSLIPTVSAIINHMELHLLHTHTHTHTQHAVGTDSQVSDYEAPSVSPPSLALRWVTESVSVFRRFADDVFLWLLPETFFTDAGIAVHGVHTLCSVLTLILKTVVVVLLTVLAHVAG